MILHGDFETFSRAPLKKCGGYRYAADPSTEVLCFCWRIDDGEVNSWVPCISQAEADDCDALPADWHYGRAVPRTLAAAIATGATFTAHNASFERAVWQRVVVPRHGGPRTRPGQYVCTATRAAASGLPRGLEALADALGNRQQKDKEGGRLLKMFAMPRKPTKADPRDRILPMEAIEDFIKLVQYCQQDVLTEAEVDEAIPHLNEFEQRLFAFDMVVNERGFRIDIPLVHKAKAILAHLEAKVVDEVREITKSEEYPDGLRPTQRDKMLKYFHSVGVMLENMQADHVRKYMRNNVRTLNDAGRRLLQLRIEAGKASTKKLASMLEWTDDDHTARGTLMSYGGHTGRYCLAVSTRVLVKNTAGTVRWRFISEVKNSELLWDGIEWVTHGGVVYSGYNYVYKHDGVTATRQHKVWVSDTECVTLSEAHKRNALIWKSLPEGYIPTVEDRIPEHRMKTYDIQFAGPRNRFALADGSIVSNSGKGIQPHNFIRGTLKWAEQLQIFKMLDLGDPDLFDMIYEWPISAISQTMRGFIIPNEGNHFYVVDYASIEARVLSWLADDTEMLEAFAKGIDVYKLMATAIYDCTLEEVNSEQRRVAKNVVLGCFSEKTRVLTRSHGYVPIYTVTSLDEVWDGVEWVCCDGAVEQGVKDVIDLWGLKVTPEHEVLVDGRWLQAWELATNNGIVDRVPTFDILNCGPRSRYTIQTPAGDDLIVHNCGYGLGAVKFVSYSEKAGVEITEELAKFAVKKYRDERYKIVQLWGDVERAAIAAVREDRQIDNPVKLRMLKFFKDRRWLCVALPSGRLLRYYLPRVSPVEKWGMPSLQLSYKVDLRGRMYSESTYGGKLVENITQAVARDLLVHGMLKAEAAGYTVRGTVHDEIITERPIGKGDVHELERIVCTLPIWAKGMPVSAEGFESPRYRKG